MSPISFVVKSNRIGTYRLTAWEGRTGKYLAQGHGVRTERSGPLRFWWKYFPVRPDLNSVNKNFIIWALYTIHEHSEYEVWTTQVTNVVCICFSGCKKLGCLKATKSSKIASHGAVRVPIRVVRLFPAHLALMRTALIRGFSQ